MIRQKLEKIVSRLAERKDAKQQKLFLTEEEREELNVLIGVPAKVKARMVNYAGFEFTIYDNPQPKFQDE